MKKSIYYASICRIYKNVTGKDPGDMKEKEMAPAILEAFGNTELINFSDEQMCRGAFRHCIEFDSKDEKRKFLIAMEDQIGSAISPK